MKTLKKTAAVILAALIVITGGAFAFADSAKTVIEWELGEDYVVEALYVGEAKEGTFTIKAMEEYEDVYYTFNAEKAGYYSITFEWYPVDYGYVAESYENGRATGDREYIATGDLDKVTYVYYFDEGVNYIGFNLYEMDSSDSYAEIKFLGEEITNVKFDESEIAELIIDVEILDYEYEEGFRWWTTVEFEFSSSKTISFDDYELVFEMKAPLEKGEVELTLNIFDYSKDYVVTACEITDIISGVRVVEESGKQAEIMYDGFVNGEKLDGMTLEVTFANGEKETAVIEYGTAYMIFPNGREYLFEVYYSYEEDDEIYLVISFPTAEESKILAHEKCEKTEASKETNRDALKENIKAPFEWAEWFFQWGIEDVLYAESFGEMISGLFGVFSGTASNYGYAIRNVFTQILAYLAYTVAR